MKDFYGVAVLAQEFDFDGARLAKAIGATFRRRKTPVSLFGRKDVAEPAFQPTHDLLEAAQGDALRALFEAVQGRGRKTELPGKFGIRHLPAAGAQESSELSFQRRRHSAQGARNGIPDAEYFANCGWTAAAGSRILRVGVTFAPMNTVEIPMSMLASAGALDELHDGLTAQQPAILEELRRARQEDLAGEFKPWKPRHLSLM